MVTSTHSTCLPFLPAQTVFTRVFLTVLTPSTTILLLDTSALTNRTSLCASAVRSCAKARVRAMQLSHRLPHSARSKASLK